MAQVKVKINIKNQDENLGKWFSHNSDWYVWISRNFLKALNPACAVLLSRICYWQQRTTRPIRKTFRQWSGETGLSRPQVRNSLKILSASGYIDCSYGGKGHASVCFASSGATNSIRSSEGVSLHPSIMHIDSRINLNDALILSSFIMRASSQDGSCFEYSDSSMARKLHISRNTVLSSVRKLESLGLITKYRARRMYHQNRYQIHFQDMVIKLGGTCKRDVIIDPRIRKKLLKYHSQVSSGVIYNTHFDVDKKIFRIEKQANFARGNQYNFEHNKLINNKTNNSLAHRIKNGVDKFKNRDRKKAIIFKNKLEERIKESWELGDRFVMDDILQHDGSDLFRQLLEAIVRYVPCLQKISDRHGLEEDLGGSYGLAACYLYIMWYKAATYKLDWFVYNDLRHLIRSVSNFVRAEKINLEGRFDVMAFLDRGNHMRKWHKEKEVYDIDRRKWEGDYADVIKLRRKADSNAEGPRPAARESYEDWKDPEPEVVYKADVPFFKKEFTDNPAWERGDMKEKDEKKVQEKRPSLPELMKKCGLSDNNEQSTPQAAGSFGHNPAEEDDKNGGSKDDQETPARRAPSEAMRAFLNRDKNPEPGVGPITQKSWAGVPKMVSDFLAKDLQQNGGGS